MLRVFYLSAIVILFSLNHCFSQNLYNKNVEKQLKRSLGQVAPASVAICSYNIKTKVKSPKFSGIVVSNDGIVLSAAHAIDPGMNYLVEFPDGRVMEAIGLGEIPTIDAAMLKIRIGDDFPFVKIGRSSSLKTGQPCFGLSYPESIKPTRAILRFGTVDDLQPDSMGRMRTSCLMEPGDSGGPVFDLDGRLIGIHSGIGLELSKNFEVPINQFRKYWSALTKPITYEQLPREDRVSKDKSLNLKYSTDEAVKLNNLEDRLDDRSAVVTSELNGKRIQAFCTIVSEHGLLVSKRSIVGNNPIIDLGTGVKLRGIVIKTDEELDLVLLKVDFVFKDAISFTKIYSNVDGLQQVGKFLMSPSPLDIGEVSVVGSETFDLEMPPKYPAFLGADLEFRSGKLILENIAPNHAASNAGLSAGDELVSINGTKFLGTQTAHETLSTIQPGDELSIVVSRNGQEITKKLKLGRRPFTPQPFYIHLAEQFTDGKSLRRDGFKNVFVHDGKIKPSECGGPVFNLKGDFVGINIARYSRTSTIVLSASEVKRFVNEAKSSLKIKN